jgi:hypothetical protein
MTRSNYLRAGVLGVVFTLASACTGGGDSEKSSDTPSASQTATPEQDVTPPPPGSSAPVQVTRCDHLRLPDGGVDEGDFDVDPAKKLLGIHFNDTRNGKYRNVAYTVRYFDDPSCRRTPAIAQLIGRVDPPGWPPLVLGPAGVGPLLLGMTHKEVANTGTATATVGSRHDGWSRRCRVLHFRPRHLGRVPGDTANGTVSARQGLEQIYATGRMITPQGIRIGSTVREVRAAYHRPLVSAGDFITVSASDRAVYRIQLKRLVMSISLELRRVDCMR